MSDLATAVATGNQERHPEAVKSPGASAAGEDAVVGCSAGRLRAPGRRGLGQEALSKAAFCRAHPEYTLRAKNDWFFYLRSDAGSRHWSVPQSLCVGGACLKLRSLKHYPPPLEISKGKDGSDPENQEKMDARN